MHGIPPVSRALGDKKSPAAQMFLFSEQGGGAPLRGRACPHSPGDQKTHGAMHSLRHRLVRSSRTTRPLTTCTPVSGRAKETLPTEAKEALPKEALPESSKWSLYCMSNQPGHPHPFMRHRRRGLGPTLWQLGALAGAASVRAAARTRRLGLRRQVVAARVQAAVAVAVGGGIY